MVLVEFGINTASASSSSVTRSTVVCPSWVNTSFDSTVAPASSSIAVKSSSRLLALSSNWSLACDVEVWSGTT
jgi:hypothetical protein